MNIKKLFFKADKAGFVLGAVLLLTLTGCVGYVNGPRAGIQVEPYAFAVQDDYVITPTMNAITALAGTNTRIGKATRGLRGQRRVVSRLTCCWLHRP